MPTDGPRSWGQYLWWLVTGRINGQVVPPTPRTPPPEPSRASYIPKAFGGILASQEYPAPWAGESDHMSDVDPSLTPEEVERRRTDYQNMSPAQRAAEWGVDVTDTPAEVVPYTQWASGVVDTLDRRKAAKLGVAPETIKQLREELGV